MLCRRSTIALATFLVLCVKGVDGGSGCGSFFSPPLPCRELVKFGQGALDTPPSCVLFPLLLLRVSRLEMLSEWCGATVARSSTSPSSPSQDGVLTPLSVLLGWEAHRRIMLETQARLYFSRMHQHSFFIRHARRETASSFARSQPTDGKGATNTAPLHDSRALTMNGAATSQQGSRTALGPSEPNKPPAAHVARRLVLDGDEAQGEAGRADDGKAREMEEAESVPSTTMDHDQCEVAPQPLARPPRSYEIAADHSNDKRSGNSIASPPLLRGGPSSIRRREDNSTLDPSLTAADEVVRALENLRR